MSANNTDIRTLGSSLDAAPIVDHIMAQPGVQKAPSAKLTLFLKRGFLTPDLCATIIDRTDAGMKVRSGVKYVITKWYRQRPWG